MSLNPPLSWLCLAVSNDQSKTLLLIEPSVCGVVATKFGEGKFTFLPIPS